MQKLNLVACSSLGLMVAIASLFTSCSAGSIDAIKTDKDVFTFIKQFFIDQYTKETFDNYYNEAIELPDTVKTKHWFKADLDNNGENDLLVCGADGRPEIFAILSFKGKYRKIILKYFCKYQFFYLDVKADNGKKIILLYSPDPTGRYDQSGKYRYTKITCDTLTILNDKFVNYCKAPEQYRIQKVIFSNSGTYEGGSPSLDVRIDAKTRTGIIIDQFNKDHIIKIARPEIDSILSLINYSNLSQLKDKYAVACTDQTTTTLTAIFDNGRIKKIEDYGSSGNFTLSEIYSLVYHLKELKMKGR